MEQPKTENLSIYRNTYELSGLLNCSSRSMTMIFGEEKR